MARYINEDEFVAWVKEHWCADCQNDNGLRCRACWIDDAIDIVEEAPEADVVPKSEVERLEIELERALRKGLPSSYQACSEEEAIKIGRGYGRAEVAREIFEEIEEYFFLNQSKGLDYATFYKLKKKYHEGEPNDRR